MEFSKIEKKWQKRWEDSKCFEVKEDKNKKKFYVLDMFPYPSATGLHMGHAFVFSLGDIFARFKRMQGFNVLYPIGYDALGLPAENAAIKEGVHPIKYTENSIKNFMKQQKAMGWSYDWSRLVRTQDSEFYRWDQWIFLKMLEKGVAFRKKAAVNWCPDCKTVLANEQVKDGKCWRHEKTDVKVKPLEQWFFRTTKYADELLSGLDKVDWPERAKIMQRNWIGRSEGTEILFEINGKKWPVFTTRPDTLFGVTFMVVSAQHSRLSELVTDRQRKEVDRLLSKIKSTREEDMDKLEKEGAFTGSYAINPLSGEKIPVWTGNFVVADYGSGMVMAVPAHDQRDFEFAKKYKVPVKVVVSPSEGRLESKSMSEAYEGAGNLVNSGDFDDLASEEGKVHITKALEEKKLGKSVVQYKLRDWLVSRQRYWGTPIPIIYCDGCGIVPVPEKDLPVRLPEKVRFGKGNPLLTSKEFLNVKCPKCKGKAKRETDTMDTFVNSSWYYLRYCDPHNKKEIFDKKKAGYWAPIDHYIGGPEHITMHLIYIRFYAKFLRDIGLLKFDEPAKRYFTQGIVLGVDGEKMSKSRGNVVDPLDVIKRYGADVLRLYLVSVASPDKDSMWSKTGPDGMWKFVNRMYDGLRKLRVGKSSPRFEHKLNDAIDKITRFVESMQYNLAVIRLRGLVDSLESEVSKDDLMKVVKMLSLFCPHIAEELWEKIGGKGFVSLAEWPKFDKTKIDEAFDEEERNFEKTVADVLNVLRIIREKSGKEPKKIYLYVIPKELESYDAEEISKRAGKEVKVFASNDKKKYDPQGKASKARPGKPGIFVE